MNEIIKRSFPTVDITNIQNILINAIISTLISITLFVIMFFTLITTSKKIFTLKNMSYVKKVLINVSIGAIFSLVSPIMYFLGEKIDSEYVIFSQVIMFMLFGLFTSSFTMVGIMPGFVITSGIFILKDTNNENINELIFILVFFCLASIWVFVSRFIFENKFIYVFISNCVFFLALTLIAFLMFDYQKFLSSLVINLISFILFLILYLLASYIFNLIDKTYKLKTSIQYDSDYFVNNGYSEIAFNEYVKKNNIETGLMLTFDFLNIEKFLYDEGKTVLEDTQKTFIKYIFYNFGERCFYFKTNKDQYALFFKINKNDLTLKKSVLDNKLENRDKNDFLKQYELILKGLPKKINYNNKEYEISISCAASVYGVHSNEFKKLEHYNQITNQNVSFKKNKNVINIFSHNSNIKNNHDIEKYLDIKKELNFANATLSLEEKYLYNSKNKKTDVYLFTNLYWPKQNIYSFNEIYNEINNIEYLSYTIRHFGYRTLCLYRKYNLKDKYAPKLVFDYSITHLEKNTLDIDSFLNKLSFFDIDLNNIIINFNFLNWKKDEINERFLKNVELLISSKIKISFSNYENIKNKKILYKFKNIVNYLFVDPN